MGADSATWSPQTFENYTNATMDFVGWNQSEFDSAFEMANADASGDWIGDIQKCNAQCNISWCDGGDFCTVMHCLDPCTGMKSCMQEYLGSGGEWTTLNCTDGVQEVIETCEWFCEYESCAESDDEVCWFQTCDDGCGNQNCTTWR